MKTSYPPKHPVRRSPDAMHAADRFAEPSDPCIAEVQDDRCCREGVPRPSSQVVLQWAEPIEPGSARALQPYRQIQGVESGQSIPVALGASMHAASVFNFLMSI